MSLVEWCERKFDPYEITNSISNIAFLIAYAVAPVRVGALRRCDQLIAVIGLGSFYFHITGSYIGELLDELPMSLLAYYYCVSVGYPIYNHVYSLVLVSVWTMYVIFELYGIFVVFFALQILLPVYYTINQPIIVDYKKKQFRRIYLLRAVGCMFVAVSCWMYERYLHANDLCPVHFTNPAYYLHSYWHFATALAHYNLMFVFDTNHSHLHF